MAAHLIEAFKEHPSVSIAVHFLRASDALRADPEDVDLAFRMLMGSSELSAIVETRHGFRFQSREPKMASPGAFAESHFAQGISELLLQGVELDRSIDVQGAAQPLRAITDDLERNFWPQRFELEWTALALVQSVPPARSWRTKHDEVFDFDGLTVELLARQGRQGACMNLHLVEALAQIHVRDQQFDLLSESVSEELEDYLAATARRFVANQRPDGTWGAAWARDDPASAEGSVDGRTALAITSHIVELSAIYPFLDLGLDRAAAKAWLSGYLVEACTDRAFVVSHYCPVTHAFRAVHLVP